MKKLLTILASILLLVHAPVWASNESKVFKTHLRLWQSRADGYAEQLGGTKQAFDAVEHDASLANLPPDSSAIVAARAAIETYASTWGRADMLQKFIANMKAHPTAGVVANWLRTSGQWIDDQNAKLDAEQDGLLASLSTISHEDAQSRAFSIIARRAQAIGSSRELTMIQQDAIAFYGDQREARALDGEQAERSAAVINALQDWSNQRAAIDAANRPRTTVCSQFGLTATCTSR